MQGLVLWRREVAVGVDVAVVLRRAGLVRRGTSPPPRHAVRDPPATPERVDATVRVTGEDVGDDVGRLARGDALALRTLIGHGPHPIALLVPDLEDRAPRHEDAAVRDHPVGADQVDRMDDERADALRDHGLRAGRVMQAVRLRLRELVLDPVQHARLDRRDVERELERLPKTHGTALEVVGLCRVPRLGAAGREVGDDVHEHGRRGHPPVVDADEVSQRLDRRARLAPAIREDIELRLEPTRAMRRVGRRPAIGEDLAGAVIQHGSRGVVDVVPAQREDPPPLTPRDLPRVEHVARVIPVGDDGRRVQPLLDDPLHPVVEGRGDPVAACRQLGAVLHVAIAEDPCELLAHLPHEVRRAPAERRRWCEHDGLEHRLVVLGGRVMPGRQHAPGLHQLEDVVAPLDDLISGRHDELRDLAPAAVGRRLVAGVRHQVVSRRGLRDGGEDRHLRERERIEVGVPIAPRRCRHSVRPIPVEVVVEVGGHDQPLALDARVRVGEAHGLDDLHRLPVLERQVGGWGGQEARPDQLHRHRRGATLPAVEAVDGGGHDPERVESRILPERLVLDRGGRVDELGRDLVEGHEIPAIAAQRREQDLAGAVVDGRLLFEADRFERVSRLGQARRDRPVDGEGDAHRERAGGEGRDHDHAARRDQSHPR